MHELDLEVIVVPVSDLDQTRTSTPMDSASSSTTTRPSRHGQDRAAHPTWLRVLHRDRQRTWFPDGARSVKGLQLVVNDIAQAHHELVARGVDVSEVQTMGVNPGPHLTRWTTWGSSSSTTRTATAGRCNRSPHGRERSGRLGRRFPGHRPRINCTGQHHQPGEQPRRLLLGNRL